MARRTEAAICPVPSCWRATSRTSRSRAQLNHSGVRSFMPVGMGQVVTAAVTLSSTPMADEGGRVTVEQDVVYGAAGAGGRELKCDVYRPPGEAPEAGWPCVVLVHGGAWRQG